MRFQILQRRPDDPFVFELLSSQDNVLLTSNEHASQDACTDAIRDTISALRDADRFGIQNDNTLVLRSESGAVLARSSAFGSRQQAVTAIASIVESAGQTENYDVTFTRVRQRAAGNALRSLQRMSDEELLALYNFTRTSRSGQPGFELFQHDDDEFYFHFNDDNGNALLYSRGFPTASKRDRRIESVIQNASIPKRYDILEQDGQYVVILKARNSQEIARSRLFPSRNAAEQVVTLFQERIPPLAPQYVKKRRARAQSAGNVYLLSQPSPTSNPGFDSFRNTENKQHYFHFNGEDGRPLLFSQGYSSTKSRDNGISSVIKNGVLPERYEGKEENGQYYFILRAGNRQEIARSRSFVSAADRDRMITAILAAMPDYATQYGITLPNTSAESESQSFTLAAPIPVGIAGGDGDGRVDDADVDTGDTVADDTMLAAPREEFQDTQDTQTHIRPAPDLAYAGEEVEPEMAYAGADDDGGGRLGIPWWIIPLVLLLGLLLFFLLRGCGSDLPPAGIAGVDETEEVTPPPTTTDPAPAMEEAGEPEGSGSTGETAEPEPPAPLGPNAAALGFTPGSLEAQLADLLSDPGRVLPAKFTMDKLQFLSQSHAIPKAALGQIDNLARLMKEYPGINIKFLGHIDGMENDDPVNLAGNGKRIPLSTIRARCLYVRMLGKNVPEGQVSYAGFGSSQPVTSNASASDRQQNRRLEFELSVN